MSIDQNGLERILFEIIPTPNRPHGQGLGPELKNPVPEKEPLKY